MNVFLVGGELFAPTVLTTRSTQRYTSASQIISSPSEEKYYFCAGARGDVGDGDLSFAKLFRRYGKDAKIYDKGGHFTKVLGQ